MIHTKRRGILEQHVGYNQLEIIDIENETQMPQRCTKSHHLSSLLTVVVFSFARNMNMKKTTAFPSFFDKAKNGTIQILIILSIFFRYQINLLDNSI